MIGLYHKILVPYDNTTQSNSAVQHAYKMAVASRASMTLFHVVPDAPSVDGETGGADGFKRTDSIKENKARAKLMLDQLKRSFAGLDVKIDIAVATGKPSHEVCKKAKIEGYDVIVMGSRGLGKIPGLLGGSVSSKVSRNAPCPVILIHAAN
ncbi:MAG: universal stress protein [Desulfotomaculaceae bacterium]|nr:universal stress protein [Desulfotomaculaceae bacterium]